MIRNIYRMSRIFAISDIHVDYKENLDYIEQLSNVAFRNDVLLLAGDVTDTLTLLETTLKCLRRKFKDVFYVPGNHELWLRKGDEDIYEDSVEKFHDILTICDHLGIKTRPECISVINDSPSVNGVCKNGSSSVNGNHLPRSDGESSESSEFESDSDSASLPDPSSSMWIVPLFAWYSTPEDDLADSLAGGNLDPNCEMMKSSNAVWSDNHMCKWTNLEGKTRSHYFADLNQPHIDKIVNESEGTIPIISFSHFLSRQELLVQNDEEQEHMNKERKQRGLEPAGWKKPPGLVKFNFSLFAGCKVLDVQIRQLGSAVHISGHQHRNRDRVIDGVRYISHCLSYPREQRMGFSWGLKQWNGPKQIWPPL